MQIVKAPTNHQLNEMHQKLNWHGDLLKNGENLSQGKNLTGYFKVSIPKNPLINNQAITSIRNLTNYLVLSRNTNLQLNFCSNT